MIYPRNSNKNNQINKMVMITESYK